jgi:hypothetical protein
MPPQNYAVATLFLGHWGKSMYLSAPSSLLSLQGNMASITAQSLQSQDPDICESVHGSGPGPATATRDRSVCELPNVTPYSLRRLNTKAWEQQEILARERLEHRACQEELQFERDRRQEADNLVGRLFELIEQAGEIADNLQIQLMQGTRTPSGVNCWSTAQVLMELHLAKSKAKILEQIVLSGQRETETAGQLLREIEENHQLQMRLLGLETRLKCNQWLDCHLARPWSNRKAE